LHSCFGRRQRELGKERSKERSKERGKEHGMERGIERDRDSAQFQWVNDWAAANNSAPAVALAAETIATPIAAEQAPVVSVTPVIAGDQLLCDIAEIERARDALAALPVPAYEKRRTQALTLVPARTTDPVPVVIGGVLALVMLTLFGAAAAMTKLAR
jgi:hypothetical protein